MTVYLDIIFLENLCMNYIILFATGYIMKLKIKQVRIILSSAFGSLYVVLVYLQNSIILSNIIVKVMLSIVMILIAFYPKKIKIFFKEIILFYLVSFVFGGCAFFLLYFIKPQNVLIRNGVYVGRYPIQIAILGGIVGFTITQIAFKLVKGKITKKDIFTEICILLNEKKTYVKALVDTGNMLKDPISGMPVIVVCKNMLYTVFPEKILDNLENIINGKLSEDILINEQEFISKFRMIPFSSLGTQNGLLLGIKVDKVEVFFDENKETVENVIVAIYDKNLSKNGEYAALLGLNIIERSERSEFTSNIKVKY